MTERKRSEENARRLVEEAAARRVAEENARLIHEQRERLHVTLASIGDAVISTDAEGRVDFLNPVAENLVGWKSEEAAGRTLGRRVPHRQRGRPASRSRTRRCGRCGRADRRAGEPHRPDLEGRHGAPD